MGASHVNRTSVRHQLLQQDVRHQFGTSHFNRTSVRQRSRRASHVRRKSVMHAPIHFEQDIRKALVASVVIRYVPVTSAGHQRVISNSGRHQAVRQKSGIR